MQIREAASNDLIQPPRRGGSNSFASGVRVEALEQRSLLTIVIQPMFGGETVLSDGAARLVSPPVYLIFWGSYWAQNKAQAALIQNAAGKVLSSPFMKTIAQYAKGRATLGDGTTTSVFSSASDPGSTSVAFAQADLGGVAADVGDVIAEQVSSGGLPSPLALANSPIYVVVTPPGVTANTNAAGVNFGQIYNGVDLNCIWASVKSIGGPSGAPNIDTFSLYFSHELAERISDPYGAGVQIVPGAMWTANAPGDQIADAEPNYYRYREPNGVVVQPLWSVKNNTIMVDDGTSLNFNLAGVWKNSNTFTGQYDLTINGDQRRNTNDTVAITTTNGRGLSVTLDGQTAYFDATTIASITINTGVGHNVVKIAAVPEGIPIAIHGGGGKDAVYVGSNHHAQLIQSTVFVDNVKPTTVLMIDDLKDTDAPMMISVDGDIVTGASGAAVTFSSNVVELSLHAPRKTNLSLQSVPIQTHVKLNGRAYK
jgi:hypothetical protein